MRRIITDDRERVSDWVADQIKCSRWVGDYSAIGMERDGALVGGVVVDGFVLDARCSVHCAGVGKTWLTREFLFAVFDYVFRQLNCNVVVNPVSSANMDSLKFTAHLGFTEVCRIAGGCTDGDLVLFTMTKGDCRWSRRE